MALEILSAKGAAQPDPTARAMTDPPYEVMHTEMADSKEYV